MIVECSGRACCRICGCKIEKSDKLQIGGGTQGWRHVTCYLNNKNRQYKYANQVPSYNRLSVELQHEADRLFDEIRNDESQDLESFLNGGILCRSSYEIGNFTKEILSKFLKQYGIKCSGSKQELTLRVENCKVLILHAVLLNINIIKSNINIYSL